MMMLIATATATVTTTTITTTSTARMTDSAIFPTGLVMLFYMAGEHSGLATAYGDIHITTGNSALHHTTIIMHSSIKLITK